MNNFSKHVIHCKSYIKPLEIKRNIFLFGFFLDLENRRYSYLFFGKDFIKIFRNINIFENTFGATISSFSLILSDFAIKPSLIALWAVDFHANAVNAGSMLKVLHELRIVEINSVLFVPRLVILVSLWILKIGVREGTCRYSELSISIIYLVSLLTNIVLRDG